MVCNIVSLIAVLSKKTSQRATKGNVSSPGEWLGLYIKYATDLREMQSLYFNKKTHTKISNLNKLLMLILKNRT